MAYIPVSYALIRTAIHLLNTAKTTKQTILIIPFII